MGHPVEIDFNFTLTTTTTTTTTTANPIKKTYLIVETINKTGYFYLLVLP